MINSDITSTDQIIFSGIFSLKLYNFFMFSKISILTIYIYHDVDTSTYSFIRFFTLAYSGILPEHNSYNSEILFFSFWRYWISNA